MIKARSQIIGKNKKIYNFLPPYINILYALTLNFYFEILKNIWGQKDIQLKLY